MTAKVKQFIEENIELIEQGKFREIYYKVIFNWEFKDVKELENILLQAGVEEAKLVNHVQFLSDELYDFSTMIAGNINKTTEKKIIALQGKDETGKTETLKKLIKKMMSVAQIVATEEKFIARMNNEHWDVWAIFEYEGRHIAITTRGDQECFINDNISKMEGIAAQNDFEIDVYICAIHTYGKTLDCIENKAKELGIKPHIYGKATYNCDKSPNEKNIQTQINDWQANFIFINL